MSISRNFVGNNELPQFCKTSRFGENYTFEKKEERRKNVSLKNVEYNSDSDFHSAGEIISKRFHFHVSVRWCN